MGDRVCDGCGKNASLTRLYQITGTDVSEFWLCQDCARHMGVERNTPRFSPVVSDLLGDLFSPHSPPTCTQCGRTFDAIRHSGKVGCSECYRWFGSEIEALLQREQLGSRHAGRVPDRLRPLKRLFVDREHLRQRLQDALAIEEYELAAEIRDHIARLEHGDGVTD